MSERYPRPMIVDTLSIGVNRPPKRAQHGRSLAPYASQGVFPVADFKEAPKSWPRAQNPKEASYFVPVTGEHEMWFDFNALSRHTHYAAVVVTVQRVNALSARKADHIYLEQYKTVCPNHDIPFEADRYCPECKYKWPAQNYLTNAALTTSGAFWLDGWRSQDGEIRQFVFADVEAGLGVAQQLIGDERTEDIRFAIFLSKNPKPVPPQLERMRRGGGDLIGSHLGDGMKGGGFLGHKLNSPVYGSNLDSGTRSMSMDVTRGGMRGDNEGFEFSLAQIGTPTRQEVSFGRAVDQQIHADPNDIDFWQPEPAAVIMLIPAPADWVATVTRNGATIDRTQGGLGPLAGLKGVG